MNFWQNLKKPFFVLAPMEAVTDVVFRHVIAQAAPPDVYFTEFTNVTSFCSPKGYEYTKNHLAFTKDEQPIVAQIWGTSPEHFAKMSVELAKMGFAGIDINMGCPAKDVVKTGACSALIENPSLAAEIISATKEGGLPVSVKTRVGFKTQKTEEWSQFLLEQDISALTIHARTQKEMSKVPARWEEIAKVSQIRDAISSRTILIGNGDVENRDNGLELARKYNADGIMIGRGIFHNPFAFESQLKDHSKKELIDLLDLHLDLFEKYQKEIAQRRFEPLKRFFKIYIKGFPGASELRDKLMHTKSLDEVRNLIKDL